MCTPITVDTLWFMLNSDHPHSFLGTLWQQVCVCVCLGGVVTASCGMDNSIFSSGSEWVSEWTATAVRPTPGFKRATPCAAVGLLPWDCCLLPWECCLEVKKCSLKTTPCRGLCCLAHHTLWTTLLSCLPCVDICGPFSSGVEIHPGPHHAWAYAVWLTTVSGQPCLPAYLVCTPVGTSPVVTSQNTAYTLWGLLWTLQCGNYQNFEMSALIGIWNICCNIWRLFKGHRLFINQCISSRHILTSHLWHFLYNIICKGEYL